MKTTSLLVVIFLTASAPLAASADCPVDAAERGAAIRARLDGERTSLSRWRWGWAAGFGALSAGQFALMATETAPTGGEFTDADEASLLAGGVKSGIGMLARVVKPVKTPRPAVTGDACADLEAAERALAITARSEKISFWLNHLGGLALQIGGTLYIGLSVDDAWGDAAISFGLGYAIGSISTYTQPRGVWKYHRSREAAAVTWRVTPLVAPRAHGLAVVGEF